ncbi:hypothetical protein, partial [Vibrio vulnificus]|uniref:hypothetical protein n=1 Tax=Vibrio vulnificus TaxID=672 RepID=UPI001F514B3D
MEDVNIKILRCLPKETFEAKVAAIEETQDLSSLAIDELIGKLLTHEMGNKKEDGKEEKRNSISL